MPPGRLKIYENGQWQYAGFGPAGSGGSGGSGLTSVGLSGANGIGVSGSPLTVNGTIALTLGNITPTSVAASGTVSGSNLTGTNTGDQTLVGLGGVPTTTTVNGHALSSNVTVTPSDLGLVIGTNVQAYNANTTIQGNTVTGSGSIVLATSPSITTPTILDSNGLNILTLTTIGSAVNYLSIRNNATGSSPGFIATGTDTNISINMLPKGSGSLLVNGVSVPTISSASTITNKDLTSGTNTFPTFNQNTSGTASNITGIAAPANGGTGVANNSANTLTFSGSFGLTLTLTATTSLTLPTSGTLVNNAVATLSSLTTVGTITSGGLGTGAVIGGVTMTLGSDSSYDLYYRNSSGVLTRLANGTTGQYLAATTSAAPSWASPSAGLTVGTSAVASGTSGYVLYNNAGVLGNLATLGTGSVILSAGTLAITTAKTLTVSNSLTLAGTDSTTMTFPSTSASIARTDAAQTFTGVQKFGSGTDTSGTATITNPTFTTTVYTQCSTNQDVMLYWYENANIAWSVVLSPTNSGGTTIYNIVTGTAPGKGAAYSLRVPKGWWVMITCATIADLTFSQVTC